MNTQVSYQGAVLGSWSKPYPDSQFLEFNVSRDSVNYVLGIWPQNLYTFGSYSRDWFQTLTSSDSTETNLCETGVRNFCEAAIKDPNGYGVPEDIKGGARAILTALDALKAPAAEPAPTAAEEAAEAAPEPEAPEYSDGMPTFDELRAVLDVFEGQGQSPEDVLDLGRMILDTDLVVVELGNGTELTTEEYADNSYTLDEFLANFKQEVSSAHLAELTGLPATVFDAVLALDDDTAKNTVSALVQSAGLNVQQVLEDEVASRQGGNRAADFSISLGGRTFYGYKQR